MYPQCTRSGRIGADEREPRRAEMYVEMLDFARVKKGRRTGADDKERRRTD
jgi:hypothetical protein